MSPINRKELQRLAKKYLNGTATDLEKEQLNRWYDTIHETDGLEVVSTDQSEKEIKQQILTGIRKEIHHNETRTLGTAPQGGRLLKMVAVFSSAAAAILVFAGIIWYATGPAKQVQQAGVTQLSISTKKITKLTLADGSLVWLNANTTFKYPAHFAGKLRQVELVEGRAFFDIKHERAHPFIVKTKTLNITVLGTSFDVRTYAHEGVTKVSVLTGKVGVTVPGKANQQAVMLLPKQQLVLNKVANQLVKVPTPEPVVNLWCKSPLVFEQANLDNVFKAIEKQYNTRIRITDKKLLDERISITLGNQRLDTIMEILSFTKHFNYQIANDSTVVVK